jgi:hypothetical protein
LQNACYFHNSALQSKEVALTSSNSLAQHKTLVEANLLMAAWLDFTTVEECGSFLKDF